jgi:hypothetical protein
MLRVAANTCGARPTIRSEKPVSERVQSMGAAALDFMAPAELFPTRYRRNKRPVGYKRFDTAAQAVRFAIEELPAPLLNGTFLQVQDQRFDGEGIRALYDSEHYPLERTVFSAEDASEK